MKPNTVAYASDYTGDSPVWCESRQRSRRVLRTLVKRICREQGLTDVMVSAYEERHPQAPFRAYNPPPFRRTLLREYRRILRRRPDLTFFQFLAERPGYPSRRFA